MTELTTTLNAIRACHPCESGWRELLTHLGKTQADDDPVPFTTILESNGLDDALWCMRTAPQYVRQWRTFALWCAEQVRPLMTDDRSTAALDVAARYLNGEASIEEMQAAADAAANAACAADAAANAARAADAAANAARATYAAAYVIRATYAARTNYTDAATQTERFIKLCKGK